MVRHSNHSSPPLQSHLQPRVQILIHTTPHTEGGLARRWTYTLEPRNVSGSVARVGASGEQVRDIATDWLPRRRLSSRCTHPRVLTGLEQGQG